MMRSAGFWTGWSLWADFRGRLKKRSCSSQSAECNQDVNDTGGRDGCARSREVILVSYMKIWRSSGITDVSLEC